MLVLLLRALVIRILVLSILVLILSHLILMLFLRALDLDTFLSFRFSHCRDCNARDDVISQGDCSTKMPSLLIIRRRSLMQM